MRARGFGPALTSSTPEKEFIPVRRQSVVCRLGRLLIFVIWPRRSPFSGAEKSQIAFICEKEANRHRTCHPTRGPACGTELRGCCSFVFRTSARLGRDSRPIAHLCSRFGLVRLPQKLVATDTNLAGIPCACLRKLTASFSK